MINRAAIAYLQQRVELAARKVKVAKTSRIAGKLGIAQREHRLAVARLAAARPVHEIARRLAAPRYTTQRNAAPRLATRRNATQRNVYP